MDTVERTERTRLRRLPDRGVFDRDTIYAILDEGFIAHVGFVHEGGPVVIPTAYGRVGDRLYLHGSSASRSMRALAAGAELCLAVTLLDGLVVARSAFHNSFNYRSVIVYGRALAVDDPAEKEAALAALTDHILPGRWAESRPPKPLELRATTVLALPIEEASAKVRTGGAVDDADDYGFPAWAGVLPLALAAGEPRDDGRLLDGVPVPGSVERWRRPGGTGNRG